MTPLSISAGKWVIYIYLSGKKIDFKDPVVPPPGKVLHASYYKKGPVPSGKVFHVKAKLVSDNGHTYVNVPNACITT